MRSAAPQAQRLGAAHHRDNAADGVSDEAALALRRAPYQVVTGLLARGRFIEQTGNTVHLLNATFRTGVDLVHWAYLYRCATQALK